MSDDACPELGRMFLCLNVQDLTASLAFYGTLGFEVVGGDVAENWAVIRRGANEIHLFQGHIDHNLINFRGGDCHAIAAHLKAQGLTLTKDAHTEGDGSCAAELHDPDGNIIYFNTFPDEAI